MIFALACTRNWYIYLATVLYSICKHNKVKKIYLFIEDDDIPSLQDKRIEFININKCTEYIKQSSPNYNTHYTKMTFVRCYFTKLVNCDKIIYVDTDALVVDNIQELWDMDLEGKLIAGVHEGGEWDKHLGLEGFDNIYINTGVLLMNLKETREQKLDDKMLEILNTKYYYLPDQDVINIVFKDKIRQISNMYNSTETTGFREDAKIIHYIRERKGWIKESPRSEIWYKYHKEMIEGGNMENYKVIAKINFTDYLGKETIPSNEHYERNVGDMWNCTKERYLYLLEHNAVDLVEIEKVELPKVEEKKETKKEEIKEPVKEEVKRKTTKRKRKI